MIMKLSDKKKPHSYKKDEPEARKEEKRKYMENRRAPLRRYRFAVERLLTSCFAVWCVVGENDNN